MDGYGPTSYDDGTGKFPSVTYSVQNTALWALNTSQPRGHALFKKEDTERKTYPNTLTELKHEQCDWLRKQEHLDI